jgi:SAM-dependent methyltransferase
MARLSLRSRIVVVLVLAGTAFLAWAGVTYAPLAAFHLLPPTVTGEEARLAELLEAAPGKVVAEIGAGGGQFSIAIARRLEPGGRLYSTELDRKRLDEIRERAKREEASNVVVVEALPGETNLPEGCCDAIFMRNVYHHIGDTASFNRSLRKSIRPGGRLAVIDFPPRAFRGLDRPPEAASGERNGHGVGAKAVAKELEAAGFILERIDDDWGGRTYLVLMRAPGGEVEGPRRPARGRPVFALSLAVAYSTTL